jgi:fermentation-respiration switch protein FrsA (DUF1100 family)
MSGSGGADYPQKYSFWTRQQIVERGGGAYLIRWPPRSWMWLLGAQIAAQLETEPGSPAYIVRLAPVPLLIMHDRLGTLVGRDESEALFAAARPPKGWLYVPGAPRAWLVASTGEAIGWLERHMPAVIVRA